MVCPPGSPSNSSGKSHPGGNQQHALFLKTIFAELQERREDCTKLKEKLERYDVSGWTHSMRAHREWCFLIVDTLIPLSRV